MLEKDLKIKELKSNVEMLDSEVKKLSPPFWDRAGRKNKVSKTRELNNQKIKLESNVNKIREVLGVRKKEIEGLHQTAKADILGSIESVAAAKSSNVGKVLGEYSNVFSGIALNISAKDLDKIKNLPYVKSVSPNLEVKTLLMDSVPLIGADKVWRLDRDGNKCGETGKECLTGKGVTIAIIDTGVDYTHPDLGGCLGSGCKVIGGYDFVNKDNDPMDDHGHGTHVAATAAGKGVLKGVAPDASIVAYKVLNFKGNGYFDDIIAAIEKAIDPNTDGDYSDHMDIISMSLGVNCAGSSSFECGSEDVLSTAVDNAVSNGIIAIVAAGNNGPGYFKIASPGTARKAITVGASGNDGFLASFSSVGPVTSLIENFYKPDVLAPGKAICAAKASSSLGLSGALDCMDSSHISLSGTSMATPHVAGVVALILQAKPSSSNDQVKQSMIDIAQGSYKLDVLSAVTFDDSAYSVPQSVSFDIGPSNSDSILKSSRAIKIVNTNDFPIEYSTKITKTYDFPIISIPPKIIVPAKSSVDVKIDIYNDKKIDSNQVINSWRVDFVSGINTIKVPMTLTFLDISSIKVKKGVISGKIDSSLFGKIPYLFIKDVKVEVTSPKGAKSTPAVNHVASVIGNRWEFEHTAESDGLYYIKFIISTVKDTEFSITESAIVDITPPEIKVESTLNGDGKVVMSISSNEDLSAYWLEPQIIEKEGMWEIRSPTLFSSGDSTFLAYIPLSEYSFEWKSGIILEQFDSNSNRIGKEKVLSDEELKSSIKNAFPDRIEWGGFFIAQNLQQHGNDRYVTFRYQNNLFCGTQGIGIKKLGENFKESGSKLINLYSIPRCPDVDELCTGDYLSNSDKKNKVFSQCNNYDSILLRELMQHEVLFANNNIYLFWSETPHNSKKIELFYSKIDQNGNVLIPKTFIGRQLGGINNGIFGYFTVKQSGNSAYIFWNEEGIKHFYRVIGLTADAVGPVTEFAFASGMSTLRIEDVSIANDKIFIFFADSEKIYYGTLDEKTASMNSLAEANLIVIPSRLLGPSYDFFGYRNYLIPSKANLDYLLSTAYSTGVNQFISIYDPSKNKILSSECQTCSSVAIIKTRPSFAFDNYLNLHFAYYEGAPGTDRTTAEIIKLTKINPISIRMESKQGPVMLQADKISNKAYESVFDYDGESPVIIIATDSSGNRREIALTCKDHNFCIPAVNIKADSSDGQITVPYDSTAELSWEALNAVSCVGFNGYDINNDGYVNINDISLYKSHNPDATETNDLFLKGMAEAFGTTAKHDASWIGTKSTSGSQASAKLSENAIYGISCKNSGNEYAYDHVKIFVKLLLPTVNIKADNSDGPITVPYDSSVALSWQSENAVSCGGFNDYDINNDGFVNINDLSLYTFRNPNSNPETDAFLKSLTAAFGTIPNNDAGWIGSKLTSGTKPTKNLVKSTNYGLWCNNSEKYAYDNVAINVNPPPAPVTPPVPTPPPTSTPEPVADASLVLSMPFEKSVAAGGIVEDYSSFKNNGRLINGVKLANDSAAGFGAYSFDGATGYINVSSIPSSLRIKNAVSLSMWIKPNTFSSYPLIKQRDKAGNGDYWITFGANNYYCSSAGGWGSASAPAQSQVLGIWTHVVLTYQNNQLKCYANGVLGQTDSNTNNIAPTGSTDPILIGGGYPAGASNIRFFNGLIDDARIYNRILTEAEASQLYLSGAKKG